MKVNGVDIARYNARQWNIEPGKRTVTNASEMLDGVSVPAMAAPIFGLREYTITIRIRGSSRTDVWNNASRILSLFRGVSEVELDGIGGAGTHMFTLSLKGVDQEEYGRMKAGWGILKLSCVGYEHGGVTTAWLDREFDFSDTDNWIATTSHTFAIEEAELQCASLPSAPTTTGVITDVILSQTNICAEDGEYFSGLAGHYYPIYAQVKIEGICRDLQGRDMGELRFEARPHTKRVWFDLDYIYPIHPDGYGCSEITIRGISGKGVYTTNGAKPDYSDTSEYQRQMPEVKTINIPAPMMWGFQGQEIKIEITSYNYGKYKPRYKIGFSHTPIYL